MKLLAAFYRMLIYLPITILVEDLHARLINEWIGNHNRKFIHSDCTWHLADNHPQQGFYRGDDFHDRYLDQLAVTYQTWTEVIHTVIGTQIGGIIVGNYQFQRKKNGLWYTAPFTHFYQIHQGQIVGVRYFMGDVSIRFDPSRQFTDLASLLNCHSLN